MSESVFASNKLLLRAVATLAASSYIATAQTPILTVPSKPSPPSLCSCSPTKFNFQLNFQGRCTSTSLTGVSDELCFVNTRPSDSIDVDNILDEMSAKQDVLRHKDDLWRRLARDTDTNNYEQSSLLGRNHRALNVIPTTINRVEIYEFDTSAELKVINQEIRSGLSLTDGDIIEFTSSSSLLDPNIPLEDQLTYFPAGVILKYVGVNSNNEYVSNIVAWGYNLEDCTTEQVSKGDYIGWTIVDDVTPANGAFCPATITPPPTPSPTKSSLISTAKPVDSKTTKPSKAGKDPPSPPSPSSSKASKASHSPNQGWSSSTSSQHKPTPTPIYDWKDKPTSTPIYDWTGQHSTTVTTGSAPSGSKSGKSKW